MLRHETKLEHIFILENSARQFKIVLDFLGLVEKFYFLSGKYDIELTVGDITMKELEQRLLSRNSGDETAVRAVIEEFSLSVQPDEGSILHKLPTINKCFSKESVEDIITSFWCNWVST